VSSKAWQSTLINAARDLAKEHNLNLRSISFTNLKGKWGLCNSHGDILLKVNRCRDMDEIIKKQEDVRTTAHELAHLKELNHSKPFWEFAEKLTIELGQKVKVKTPPEKRMI